MKRLGAGIVGAAAGHSWIAPPRPAAPASSDTIAKPTGDNASGATTEPAHEQSQTHEL